MGEFLIRDLSISRTLATALLCMNGCFEQNLIKDVQKPFQMVLIIVFVDNPHNQHINP